MALAASADRSHSKHFSVKVEKSRRNTPMSPLDLLFKRNGCCPLGILKFWQSWQLKIHTESRNHDE